MYYYIYKITCTEGTFKNHFYYGQHCSKYENDNYKGSGALLKKYYKKYPTSYIKEIVKYCNTAEELNIEEEKIVNKHINDNLCLNILKGGTFHIKTEEEFIKFKEKLSQVHIGENNPMYGKHPINSMKGKHYDEEKRKHIVDALYETIHKPEILEKISKKLKGKPAWNKGKHISDETKRKISESCKGKNKGKHLSEEQKEKLKLAHTGKKQSQETIQKRVEKLKGRHLSEEHKEKLKLAHIGKHLSEDQKRKISENNCKWNKGQHLSEEHRRKISESHKGKKSTMLGKHHSEETKRKISESNKHPHKKHTILSNQRTC